MIEAPLARSTAAGTFAARSLAARIPAARSFAARSLAALLPLAFLGLFLLYPLVRVLMLGLDPLAEGGWDALARAARGIGSEGCSPRVPSRPWPRRP